MFDIYIYKAIEKQHLNNQNQLCKLINISSAAMADLKNGKKLPSENTVLKVAALAGIPAEKALIDLNMWRAKGDEKRLNVWKNISKMLGGLSAISLILLSNLPALSHLFTTYTVYYVYYGILTIILIQYFRHFSKNLTFDKVCKFKILRKFQRC